MKEAVGSAMLLNIALVFIGVISMILVSSIAYSKAFKAKNQIISAIEDYDGQCVFDIGNSCFDEIEQKLTNLGYSSNIAHICDNTDPDLIYGDVTRSGHAYCVYKHTLCDTTDDGYSITCKPDSSESYYYKVVTYMHFDIPVIGRFLEFPVSGETPTFYEKFQNVK